MDGLDAVRAGQQSVAEAFTTTLSMIVVSELGDKTFFIAALLAMRHDRRAVFLGSASALVAMTVLSVLMGVVLPALLPRQYTHWAAVGLFVYFGAKLLMEAVKMFRDGEGDGPSDELDEVEKELKDRTPTGKGAVKGFSAIFMQALTLTFVAEWGDRSQISTIALAAAKEPLGVVLGGSFGHCCCTCLAVIGGKYLATSISERVVVGSGGLLFLAFALHGLITGSPSD
mmetsp:Transcript_88981/g.251109  ORF Transcript_88981/g.251109 Transcript_88981/m.251109 type:complete len:228 (+) Transcript_88981:108-791(+)